MQFDKIHCVIVRWNSLGITFESSHCGFWILCTTVFCAFHTIIVDTCISTSLLVVYHTSFKLFASVFGEPFGKPYCFSPVWPAAVPSRESSVTVKFLAASFKGEVVRVGRMDHYQTPRSMERCRLFFFFSFLFFSFFSFLSSGPGSESYGRSMQSRRRERNVRVGLMSRLEELLF